MSENMDNRRQTRRLSSILKTVAPVGDSPTQTFSRRSKRISFSHVNNVKEFVADGNNQTIWGESYENPHKLPDGSSSGSVPDASNFGSTCTAQTLRTESMAQTMIFGAPAPTIDLFADIENASAADVEMSVSLNDSETKLFNQTMFIEEETHTTSLTNCHVVDMSMVGNKRKTIETISVDQATTDVVKSVKIRKMNDENVEPNIHNTILHHVNMSVSSDYHKSIVKADVNLNATRIFDGDADMSDVDHLPQSSIPIKSQQPPAHSKRSNMLDNTTVSTTDITIDDQSIASSISETYKPIVNKTYIFGRGDISAGIDETFAVRHPVQENNVKEWNSMDKSTDSGKNISKDSDVESSPPILQHSSGTSRQRTLEDLTISMDIKFKNHSLSTHSLMINGDEPAIEDLTICLDTNFQAEVSGENDSAMQSMDKSTESLSMSDSATKNKSEEVVQQKPLILYHTDPSMASTDHFEAASKENVFGTLPSTLTTKQNAHNLTSKLSKDMTLDSVVDRIGPSTREKMLSPVTDIRCDLENHKFPKYFDCSASQDQVHEPDFTFAYSEPLSSTRFLPSNKFTHLSDGEINTKANSSNGTFNYCPTLTTRQSRSGVSLQNNTDELCNLEPDQLKTVEKQNEMKKYFLSISDAYNDMLSETKMDLVNASVDDEPKETTAQGQSASEISKQKLPETDSAEAEATETPVYKEPRCQKCLNCRKSLDGNTTTYLRKDQLEQPKLNLNLLDEFKGMASLKDVIEAHKKRQADRELKEQLFVDQNVEAPDIRFLRLNKKAEEKTSEPQPVHVFEPLTCFPLRMNVQYLMRNKIRTEYTHWNYIDNFFYIGAVALRHQKIPSIRIHIKFDTNGPAKAEELNMPLLFKRVFIEECSTYLRRISPGNYLKHKNALAALPTNLITILSDSSDIYRGLDQIENWFQHIVDKVDELDALTVEHDAKLVLDNGQCFIEQTIFDVQTYWIQELGIKLDRIDSVGPKNVIFRPSCETTNEFKTLPSGLPFLRLFLADPKSYLVRCLER